MNLDPYTSSSTPTMPDTLKSLWEIPKELFNKCIVVSVKKLDNGTTFHTIIFRWNQGGWDGIFPEMEKFSFTQFVGTLDGLYVIVK